MGAMGRPLQKSMDRLRDFQQNGYTDLGTAELERRGRIGWITLKNLNSLNAEDDASTKNLEIAVDLVLLDPQIEAGVLRGGDPVQPSETTFSVQVNGGDQPTTTDGPMQKGGPWLNGYWVLECKNRDEAIAWAAKIPAAHGGGTVEVHPIFSM